MKITIPDFVMMLAGSLCFLLALAFLLKQKSNLCTKWVTAIFFLSIFGTFFLRFLEQVGTIDQHPHLLNLNYPLGLVRPALFFLVVKYAIMGNQARLRDGLHFIPVILLLVYLYPYYSLPGDQKAAIEHGVLPYAGPTLPSYYRTAGLLYAGMYLILSGYAFWQYYKRVSNRNKINLKWVWIGYLFVGYLLFILSGISTVVSISFIAWNNLGFFAFSVMIIVFCLLVLRQSSGLTTGVGPEATFKLSKERRMEYLATLHKFEMDEMFLRNSRLDKVAANLKISERVLSQIVQEEWRCTFSDWINHLRVEKAKRLLHDTRYDHLTIDAIGQESGFTSRVSFYTVFRAATGCTPKNFKLQRLIPCQK